MEPQWSWIDLSESTWEPDNRKWRESQRISHLSVGKGNNWTNWQSCVQVIWRYKCYGLCCNELHYTTWRSFKNVNRTKNDTMGSPSLMGWLADWEGADEGNNVVNDQLSDKYVPGTWSCRMVTTTAAFVNRVYYACCFLSWVVLWVSYRLIGTRSSYWWLSVQKLENRSSQNLHQVI